MQIVIDIDDNLYTRLFDNGGTDAVDMLNACVAIRKGTPLPKGYGRLFDERDIVNGNYEIIGNKIYEAEPIIEADKESEENAGWCNTCEYKYLESKCLGCAKYDKYGNLITLSKYKKESEDKA